MFKGLTSWIKTSEGVLTFLSSTLLAVVPDFPVEALYSVAAYVLGRSWVKGKGKP